MKLLALLSFGDFFSQIHEQMCYLVVNFYGDINFFWYILFIYILHSSVEVSLNSLFVTCVFLFIHLLCSLFSLVIQQNICGLLAYAKYASHSQCQKWLYLVMKG